jgi:hypothetical protein
MDQSSLLVIAMAEECNRIIQQWHEENSDLPESIRRKHLERMCERIEKHSEDWPATRLHRWIGYIQCALIANRVIDLAEAKRMFDRAKIAYPEADVDLLDHLDPNSSFEFDIGGLG